MGTVLLVRHTESTWNRQQRVQGWEPTTLTDRGRAQARKLRKALMADEDTEMDGCDEHLIDRTDRPAPGVDRVFASDLQRARETARVLTRDTDCQPTFDRGWRERKFGRLRGRPTKQLFERNPELSLRYSGQEAAHARPDGGETLDETRQRVLDAWERLQTGLADGETVVVISHSIPISLVLGDVQNESLTAALLDREQDTGAVNELRVNGDDTRVIRENWTDYRTTAGER